MRPRYPSVSRGAIADVGRAIAVAAGGALAFAPLELVLSIAVYHGPLSWGAKLRFVALVATLALVLWFVLALALGTAAALARYLRALFYGRAAAAAARGPFDPAPVDEHGIRAGVPRLFATLAAAAVIGAPLARAIGAALAHKEAQLTALVITAYALGACLVAAIVARALAVPTTWLARKLAGAGAFNPLGRWRAAGVLLVAGAVGAVAAIYALLPAARTEIPYRLLGDAAVILVGGGLGAFVHDRPGSRPRRRLARVYVVQLAVATCALVTVTLLWWGADPETRYIVTQTSGLAKLEDLVRVANDVDRDGYGSLLGENDCAPFDRSIHPEAKDLPDDGIDQNCDGHDFTLHDFVAPPGANLPVPAQFAKRDWNFLFITIDTLRYDRTTFGGYPQQPPPSKHRDTTPELAKLVARSTSFTFTNAPSAGTMASIPAIITSKYFHSGIALDENLPPGNPPKLMPENTTLPEIMKRGGYYTGVIASHEYWNNWGMDQGVDEYDNSIGKTPDPYRSPADKVTDRALAFISRQANKKWFLWTHYIDPHGRYVAHPDVVDWAGSEPDLYDAEVRWTDQEVGRLLRELANMPNADRTIVIITSDHGDSMAEHNVPLGTHGTALYRELLHVPMIFYIPENKPRLVGGAVSNLDIVPSVAALAGIDVHDLQFEGRSLVPQLFYGKEDHARIVFSETNAPMKQRAAVSEAYKLIFYMTNNTYELFDLKKDPWEHDNLATKVPQTEEPYLHMKAALDDWLQRVVYAKDPKFNQAYRTVADIMLPGAPSPAVAVAPPIALAGGTVEVLGFGVANGAVLQSEKTPKKAELWVYLHATAQPKSLLRFELEVWPIAAGAQVTDPIPHDIARSTLRATADGFYPTTRWGAGQYIRERFKLDIPADWKGDRVVVALAVKAEAAFEKPTTPTAGNEPNAWILGVLPLGK